MCPACDGWAVETGTVATGRMRVSVCLTVTGAFLLMVGVITVLVGETLRLKSSHDWPGIVGLGEAVAACGLGCGLALLFVVAAARPGRRGPAAGSHPEVQSRPAAQSPAAAQSRPAARSHSVVQPDPVARPGRDDRARHPSEPSHAWQGGPKESWLRDSAEEWLSPLRNARARQAPEPDRWSGQHPIQEFSPALEYADDGWRPERETADSVGDSRPAGPPRTRRPGGHRTGSAAGPQPGYPNGPQPAHKNDPSPLHMGPVAGYQMPAYQTVPTAGYRAEPPPREQPRQYRADIGYSHAEAGETEAADTAPLPVVLPSSAPPPAPAATAAPAGLSPDTSAAPSPAVPAPAQAKLDQIKDLYLTAEAIGEDALVRHFEEVSYRQRELIREYFEQSGVGPKAAARILEEKPSHTEAPLRS
jgi:hypothetical protein